MPLYFRSSPLTFQCLLYKYFDEVYSTAELSASLEAGRHAVGAVARLATAISQRCTSRHLADVCGRGGRRSCDVSHPAEITFITVALESTCVLATHMFNKRYTCSIVWNVLYHSVI